MPCFNDLFFESKGQPVPYEHKTLILADKFTVSNGDKLKISIEKTNSKYVQGLSIDITGSCELQGKIWEVGKGVKMIFWEDSTVLDPKNIQLTVFTKTGFVWVQNIWEKISSYQLGTPSGETITKETKSIDAGHGGAAMIVEQIENGKRYHCNDGHPDDNFDDIVFTVQKIN
ncbi:MAG: hypothetical protein K2X08_01235 [Chlamydiales bacterium]|nr:hypothetical protein [Chlamydiales bacterium]MBY0530202.1 hypothetical protein [Rhabdochlamydiaceae bacterium]